MAARVASIEAFHQAMLLGGAACSGCGRGLVVRAPRPAAPSGEPSRPSMPRDWDARTYDRVADPMTRWGAAVLDRLALDGDERVLDAGCGTGRVTEALAERLPRGRVSRSTARRP